jgi:hypothetical protein
MSAPSEDQTEAGTNDSIAKFLDSVREIKGEVNCRDWRKEKAKMRLELLRLAIEIAPKPRNHYLVMEVVHDFEMMLLGRHRNLKGNDSES